MTKLFLIEGLPCSGKSTTSRYVARKLEEMGKRVYFFDEGTGNHPADYEFHSFLDLFLIFDFSMADCEQGKKLPEKATIGNFEFSFISTTTSAAKDIPKSAKNHVYLLLFYF